MLTFLKHFLMTAESGTITSGDFSCKLAFISGYQNRKHGGHVLQMFLIRISIQHLQNQAFHVCHGFCLCECMFCNTLGCFVINYTLTSLDIYVCKYVFMYVNYLLIPSVVLTPVHNFCSMRYHGDWS